MIDVRPFYTLGGANHGWLNAKHHFSFANYYDPARMSWGRLRVWNDDEIAAKSGFPPHPHADMEIITYVRTGAITHEDSMGNKGRTGAGDVQVMSAGTGVRHSEFNLENEMTTLFQIWIETDKPGAKPDWGMKPFPKSDRSGKFQVLASGDPTDEALTINADARVLGATIKAGETATYPMDAGRNVYLVVAKGAALVNGARLGERDGAALSDVASVDVTAEADVELRRLARRDRQRQFLRDDGHRELRAVESFGSGHDLRGNAQGKWSEGSSGQCRACRPAGVPILHRQPDRRFSNPPQADITRACRGNGAAHVVGGKSIRAHAGAFMELRGRQRRHAFHEQHHREPCFREQGKPQRVGAITDCRNIPIRRNQRGAGRSRTDRRNRPQGSIHDPL
jgi:redox-sensitive bicupin YhaK (pirin superfamily)